MEFDDFKSYVDSGADFRPVLSNVVRRHIETEGALSDSFREAAWQLFREVERKVSPVAPGIKFPQSGEEREAGGAADKYYETKIKDWEHTDPSKRGNQPVAIAFAFWFFRYCSKNSYFKEIAAGIWPHSSETFKRFIYAKCGGAADDGTETIDRRFKAEIDEVEREFKKLWIEEKPPFKLELPAMSNQVYHYTNNTIKTLGRKTEQDALKRFRDAGPGFRWWQIAGGAGQGKSRLALDLIKKTRDEFPDWHSGFLAEEELERFVDKCGNWKPTRPHLIVVDYVLGRTEFLKTLMQTLVSRSSESLNNGTNFEVPICLLLIERQPWDRGGFREHSSERAEWYSKVTANSRGYDSALEKALYRDPPGSDFDGSIELTALEVPQLCKIVETIGNTGDTLIEASREAIEAQLKKIDDQGRPLYAYFLGKALGAGKGKETTNAEDLLNWVLETDRRNRWMVAFGNSKTTPKTGDHAPEIDGYTGQNPAMHIAVLAVVIRRLNCNNFFPTDQGWVAQNHETRRQAQTIADNEISFNPSSVVFGLEPDLLGEWFVLESIKRQHSYLNLLNLAWKSAPRSTAEFFVKIARDFPHHPSTTEILNSLPNEKDPVALKSYTEIASTVFSYMDRQGANVPNGVIRVLLHASEQGNIEATTDLGVCFYYGLGVVQNKSKALSLYEAAAAAGDGTAKNNLGLCFYTGDGVPEDKSRAFELFLQSARSGIYVGMVNLGVCLYHGNGTKVDVPSALRWTERAAEFGNSTAMFNLGLWHLDGNECEHDLETALHWFGKSAERWNARALYQLGVFYLVGERVERNVVQAIDFLSKSADQGHAEALYLLGSVYEGGYNVDPDLPKALDFYRKSAEGGNGDSMQRIGSHFESGLHLQRSEEQALGWYLRGASYGSGAAMSSLGNCYERGFGVAKNLAAAFSYYESGAVHGNAAALANLGVYYEKGVVVDQDLENAVKLYRAAAAKGDGTAMANLGTCYENGKGVKQSFRKAAYWYCKGSRNDDGNAIANLGVCYLTGRGVKQDVDTALQLFLRGDEIGNGISMFYLGLMYSYGGAVEKDAYRAEGLFRKALASGHPLVVEKLRGAGVID